MCFKSILKTSHSNYLLFYSSLPVKFAIFLKSSLLFNSSYCLFCLYTKFYSSIALKLELLWMQKFQFLLYVLKWSYICYYIICMAVSWTKAFVFFCTMLIRIWYGLKVWSREIYKTCSKYNYFENLEKSLGTGSLWSYI